ncbi:hypothetical protein KKF91_05105 [Myxococcota bacterium]|nr:hypothetical protein [Myxococcota bacterium]MBU1429925.1 hypothetical protein [Myxococcota bacterium]MBU1897813.1 hypothetical protein [Myxococcota bacterium]
MRGREAMSGLPPVDELLHDEARSGPLRSGLEPPSHAKRPFPLYAIIIGVLVTGLGALWYLSMVRYDHFYLVKRGEVVFIERGWYFPFGQGAWVPHRAYEPFNLPAGISLSQRDAALTQVELEQALYRIFVQIATRELANIEAGDPDVAEDMLMRANKLGSTTLKDDRRLLEMLGDVAFRRGLNEVKSIQSRFDEALKQFQLAARRGGVTYRGANHWVRSITRLREEIRRLSLESGLDPDQILTGEPPQLLAPPSPPEPLVYPPPALDPLAPSPPLSDEAAGLQSTP